MKPWKRSRSQPSNRRRHRNMPSLHHRIKNAMSMTRYLPEKK
jgi:hypothetical protein